MRYKGIFLNYFVKNSGFSKDNEYWKLVFFFKEKQKLHLKTSNTPLYGNETELDENKLTLLKNIASKELFF